MVGGFNHLEKYEFVNGKDYPIYYGNYSTSCDPHHDMSGRIFGHIFSIF